MGRPKLKAKERKEIFPLRLSALEIQAIRETAGDEPLAKWMRRTLLASIPPRTLAKIGIKLLMDEAAQTGSASVSVQPAPTAAAPKDSPRSRAAEVPS